MAKRALWLLNHTTLREFEVPLLVEMGFEVFTPKVFQVGVGDGSASITYEYDKTLSIPQSVLEKINKVDFYDQIDRETLDIINNYFDIAFFHYFTNQFRWLVDSFKGVLVFQAFGLMQNISYSEIILLDHGLPFFLRMRNLGQRLFFAQAYPNLKEIECDYFKQRAIDMPLGLKGTDNAKRWVGGDPRFLFVLPRINTSAYFKSIYQKFKKDFSDTDYIIAGAQPIPVTNDSKVAGFMSKSDFECAITHCCAMFYHSTEKYHIHYHPFEAIKMGMPLIFMGGGMMDTLGGKDQPGRCETVGEAHRKLSRLSKGDKRLARKITESQNSLLWHFSYENCHEKWSNGIKKIYVQLQNHVTVKNGKKIAVILPQPYLGGILDYTIRMVKCLKMGAEEYGDDITIVLGYPDDPSFKEKNYFKEIEKLGVSSRAFTWKEKTRAWVDRVYGFMSIPCTSEEGCCVLDDGCNYFQDCDYIIFTADRIPASLFSTVPYIIVAHDYIQRYIPEMFGSNYEASFIEAARKSDAVFVTTPATQDDAIQYGGLSKEKVILTPLMFDLIPYPEVKTDLGLKKAGDYFLWSTNSSAHKNHIKALHGLSAYYQKGGTLNCVISGVNTDLFDVKIAENKLEGRITEYVRKVRKMITEDKLLKSHIFVKGNMPKEQYIQVLQKAKFVFHPGYADNGNGTAIDAACFGIPTICSDYPAMRYINEYTGINMHFFDPFDEDSIENVLTEAEKEYPVYAQGVPSREELKRFTVEGSYRKLFQTVRKVMG